MNYTNSLPLLASFIIIAWYFVYPYTYYGWSRFFIEFIAFDFEKFTKENKEDEN